MDKALFMRRAQNRLYAEARCNGKESYLFDQTEHGNLITDLALGICAMCTVQEDCLLIVNPADSLYDGIAGGIVFKNGKIVERNQTPPQPKLRKLRKMRK